MLFEAHILGNLKEDTRGNWSSKLDKYLALSRHLKHDAKSNLIELVLNYKTPVAKEQT